MSWTSYLNPLNDIRYATDKLGITTPAPPDLTKTKDAQTVRDFGATLRNDYQDRPDSIPLSEANVGSASLPMLKAAAEGTAPSAATQLYRQGVDEAQKSALGRAATLQGSNPGMALRYGLSSGNDAVLNASAGGAALRANEMATGRQQYTDALNKVAGNAINVGQANQNYGLGLGNLAESATLAPYNAAVANQQLQLQAAGINQKGVGAVAGAAGGLLSKATSDREAKRDIRPKSYADALASKVHGVEFTYKPGIEDGGKHFGVIAQDVEKVFPGAVGKRADGLREVKIPHLTTANTALIAELAKRVKSLEGGRRA